MKRGLDIVAIVRRVTVKKVAKIRQWPRIQHGLMLCCAMCDCAMSANVAREICFGEREREPSSRLACAIEGGERLKDVRKVSATKASESPSQLCMVTTYC